MNNDVLFGRLLYYWRHGLYGHVKLVAQQTVASGNSDVFVGVWLACALAKIGEKEEAVKGLGPLMERGDLGLIYCVVMECISEAGDDDLKGKLESAMETANCFAVTSAAFWAWVFSKTQMAKWILSHLEKGKLTGMHGWLEIAAGNLERAKNFFDGYLRDPLNARDLVAMYGKAIAHAELGEYQAAIQGYTKILSYCDFDEIHLEKARIYVAMKLWDMAHESLISAQEKLCSPLEVHAFLAIHDILNEGDLKSAEMHLSSVVTLCKTIEPKNWKLHLIFGKCFLSLCHETPSVVAFARQLAELARQSTKKALNFLSYCEILENNLTSAALSLKDIEDCDIYSIEANIRYLVRNNLTREAYEQIELYRVSCGNLIQIQTLWTKRLRLDQGDAGTALVDLADSLAEHVVCSLTDTDFTLSPMECKFENVFGLYAVMRLDSVILCLDELVVLNKSYLYGPGGELGLKIGDTIQKLLEITPKYVPLRLLYASFLTSRGRHLESLSVIHPLLISKWQYRLHLCLISAAQSAFALGNITDAKDYLSDLVKVSEVSNLFEFVLLQARLTKQLPQLPVSQTLALTSLIELVDVCLLCDRVKDAEIFFLSAAKLAKHPREKAALVIRQAKLSAAKGNTQKAFDILLQLREHMRYRDIATTVEADIRLNFLHDKRGYISCFENLCKEDRTARHLEMLGDAYATVFEYENASVAFQSSLNLEYKATTQEKMVRALIESHQFNAAFASYKQVGVTPVFVIELLLKVKHYEQANDALLHSLRLLKKGDILTLLKYMELLGDVKMAIKAYKEAVTAYEEVHERYKQVLMPITASVYARKLKVKLAGVCKKLGDVYSHLHDNDKSMSLYEKATQYDMSNAEAVVSLFNCYKQRGDIEKCRAVCISFLEKTPNSEKVALLLTTIEVKDYKRSIAALSNLISQHPKFYRAIVRLIEVCARAGEISIARDSLKHCTGDTSPGMEFCRGLLAMYSGDNDQAIEHLNRAARNERWTGPSKLAMFGIYTNPDKKYIWCEKEPLASREYLETAAEILGSLKLEDNEVILMTAEFFAAHNTTPAVDKACKMFETALKTDPTSVQAMVGIAKCKIRLGQTPAATNLIERVLRLKPFHETYIFFEECYLMQSHIVSHEFNFRSYEHFVFLALDLNLSSKKAWEMSAKIHKRNKMFQEAANAYHKCWELGGFKDKDTGLKCVICLLKAKKPDDALVLCNKIFDMSPISTPRLEALIFDAFKKLFGV